MVRFARRLLRRDVPLDRAVAGHDLVDMRLPRGPRRGARRGKVQGTPRVTMNTEQGEKVYKTVIDRESRDKRGGLGLFLQPNHARKAWGRCQVITQP